MAKETCISNIKLSRNEIIRYLKTEDQREIEKLFESADAVRKKYVGDEVHLRGIIEFSNYCSRNCLYCGLRKDNVIRPRYRMNIEEIFQTASQARALGYMTIVLQSGEDEFYRIDDFCALIQRIKKELNVAITLSMGEFSRQDYEKFKKAGADRYLIRFETSDRKLFTRLKPDSNYSKRIKTLYWLKELGFQTGSGIMTGLPGQTIESIADDILFFDKLKLDMIGIGPFIPNLETPLKETTGGNLITGLKVIALTRLVTLDTHIPATTALAAIDSQGRQKAFKCGANVIMPNITPQKYRKHYLLYPGKICTDENPQDCKKCVEAMLVSMGRTVSKNYGHHKFSKIFR